MHVLAGALRFADLGYFSLDTLQRLSAGGGLWLTRWQVATVILDEQGQPVGLLPWLAAHSDVPVDCPVLLGQTYRLPARLLAVRVPPEVAKQRRSRLLAEAQRRYQMVSPVRLAAADWTISLTNVSSDRLTLQEGLVLGRARWQIERLFKLWKSYGSIDESRSAHPWRILCKLYAKLLAMVIQHWVLLTTCWRCPDRSLVKAGQTVRSYGLVLALALAGLVQMQTA